MLKGHGHSQKRKRFFVIASFLLIFLSGAYEGRAKSFISPEEAIDHVGEYVVVCGTVESSRYAFKSKGQPTFLNLDEPYPKKVFTALIWGSDRDKFEAAPEELYEGKEICVEGLISVYRNKAQIVVSEPSQITLREEGAG